MASKRSNKCRICGDLFTADPRNRKRQKYCPRPACKAAGKAARQRRWLAHEQNRDYFCGPEQVQRVREWRAAHPGYWRGKANPRPHPIKRSLAKGRQIRRFAAEIGVEPRCADALNGHATSVGFDGARTRVPHRS
jgi:hypothetical protein